MKGGFFKGLLLGAVLAGGAALLFSKKGEETREALKEKIDKIKDDIERKKKELEEAEAKMKAASEGDNL